MKRWLQMQLSMTTSTKITNYTTQGKHHQTSGIDYLEQKRNGWADISNPKPGKANNSAFFPISYLFIHNVEVAGVNPESDVPMRYIDININLDKLQESAVSHVLSKLKPIVHSRETNSPASIDDDSRRLWQNSRIFNFSWHKSGSQRHTTKTKTTVNTYII